MSKFHMPVLLKEVVEFLDVKQGKKYIDATVGGGGHVVEILRRGGEVLGIDHDPEALKETRKRLMSACSCVRDNWNVCAQKSFKLVKGNFADLRVLAEKNGFLNVSGILFDLGVSTHQLKTGSRGFSFERKAMLDMRMDPELGVTAKDLVNALGRKELYELFTKLAQERCARAVAADIVCARKQKPIETTLELATIVEDVYRKKYGHKKSKIHPATKVFQALRIAVNDELNNLKKVLPQAVDLLGSKGRLVVISFHEGEDRIVKHFFRKVERDKRVRVITKKPVRPKKEEVAKNLNSRSAKMRVIEKI